MKTGKLFRLCGALALISILASCQSTDQNKKTEKKDRFSFLRRNEGKKSGDSYEEADKERVKPAGSDKNLPSEAVLNKLEKKVKTTPVKPVAAPKKFYDEFIALNGDEEVEVSLVFNSAPLLDVLSAFGDILGFNFVADSDLKGVITLNLNSKMSRRELWNSFDRMLTLAGAGVKVEDSLLRIMALAKLAKQPDQRPGSGSDTEIYYKLLTGATAKEVATQIRQFLGTGGVCAELTRPNAVLVCDDRESMGKIREIIECLDNSGKRNWPRAVIPCVNVLPNKVAVELQELLPVLGLNVYKTTDRSEIPGAVQILGIDRMRLLVVSAATQEAVDMIKEWVKLLDSAGSDDQENVFVYKVRYNKASHLARAIAVVFETQGSALSIDASTGNQKIENITSPANRANRTTGSRTTTRSQVVNAGTNMETDQGSKLFSNTVRVFADGVLNRLVIRSTPRTYASIKALLDRLDVVPAQVLLQVLVVEVTLTENTKFGLEFSGSTGGKYNTMYGTNYGNGNNGVLNPFAVDPASGANLNKFATGADRQTGATFVISNPKNPQTKFGYIRALAGDGLVKVISSPQLLVSSHTEAKIQVGQSVPVITSGITNTSSSGSINQNYQYKETGVILTVTPQVTSTNLIQLDVEQTLSSAGKNDITPEINSPLFTVRNVNTAMTIPNGATSIIGGLIQEEKNDSLSSFPIIKDIPFLKRLFGSTEASIKRSEILVLITGTIINEHSRLEEMIKRYDEAIKALNDFDNKLGDRPDSAKKPKGMFEDLEFWK